MPRPLPRHLIGSGICAALIAGAVVAAPFAASAVPDDGVHGLLVLSVEQPSTDPQYASVDNARGPFSGTAHSDLLDAVEQAADLDLSRFESDGRIKLDGADTCLGITPASDTGTPRRAMPEPCVDGDPDQEWRVRPSVDDRLQNVGAGLWVADPTSDDGWTMSSSLSAAPVHVMTTFLDGRPEVTPRVTTTYDHATDTVTVHGRNGTPSVPVTMSDGQGTDVVIATSSADGAFDAVVPPALSNRSIVEVRFGDEDAWAAQIRPAAVTGARFAIEADGTRVLRGTAARGATVSVGTGPLEADVVASADASAGGGFRIPVPDARPGDTFFVYQRADGVRSRITVPNPTGAVVAVDGPLTELDRLAPTAVPVGVVATLPVTSLTTDLTLSAPEGTVFTPGTTSIQGQFKPSRGAWQNVDPRLRIDDVTISPDGRSLSATATVTSVSLAAGDEIRWLPTLDVIDAEVAPAAV